MNARPSFHEFCQPTLEAIDRANARRLHANRKAVIDQYKAEPSMLFHAIRPSLSTQEAIEEANRTIFRFRNLASWKQQNPARLQEVERAMMNRLAARFFRRFGRRIWIDSRSAAA